MDAKYFAGLMTIIEWEKAKGVLLGIDALLCEQFEHTSEEYEKAHEEIKKFMKRMEENYIY